MRGLNVSTISGNVGSRIQFSTTVENIPSVSFDVLVEEKTQRTWIRVNVFGGVVGVCRNRLHPGGYVQVSGRLMNAKRRLELRAEQVVFGGSPDK